MRLHSNKYVEALLYLTVPLAVHVVLTPRLLRRVVRKAKALVAGDPDRGYVVREVSVQSIVSGYNVIIVHGDGKKSLLQSAIASHLATIFKHKPLQRDDVLYRLTEKPLEQVVTEKLQQKHFGVEEVVDTDNSESGDGSDDDESEDDDDDDDDATDQLLRLSISAFPETQKWVEVEPGVEFQYVLYGYGDVQDEELSDDKDSRPVNMVFRFRSKRAHASQAIDQLVKTALLNYQKKRIISAAQDTKRYLFVQTLVEAPSPAASGSNDDNDPAATSMVSLRVVFKRYPLGENKSFKNLFFQDKHRVLSLLDNFTQRRGKFAVKGFPYKLGLLLHGPPGTGKTSLIKAVAKHTNRHIVTISLAKIATNQELMDAMFDLRFPVQGRDKPIVLGFQDVVFVMEDIDCAGASVVEARVSDDVEGNSDGEDAAKQKKTAKRPTKTMTTQANDKLNLSGLLNVLDGVIDCPGRIVIMTTNHPEKLDPALIRPGRVNAQLRLGFMGAPQIQEMLEYYFSTPLSDLERQRVVELHEKTEFTPAYVEQVCAEHATLEQAIQSLQMS